LTKGVTKSPGQESSWTMSAIDVRVFTNAFARLGHDVDRLLDAAELRRGDLEDSDARIPCEAVGRMAAWAQRERFTSNLGLELAARTPMGAWPLLDYLVLTSDTVGAGVRQLARYFRLTSSPVTIDVRDDSDRIRVEMTAAPAMPLAVEYDVALMILHFRTETEGRFRAASVTFQHTPDDTVAFERVLGCPVRTAQPWNGVHVAPESWRLPLRRRDPVLRQVLETQANEILARLPNRTGVALEVQRGLMTRVAGGDTRIEALARHLAMSPRTLQRRLAAEGVSYQQLLEDTRKQAAGRYVSGSNLAISEVAYLIGYSEPAPFHRAFKRWYGMTPDVFRQRQRPS